MIRTGEVTRVENGRADILFLRPEACEKCGACKTRKHITRLEVSVGDQTVRAGDKADVFLPEGMFLRATALAYVLPLVGLLGGLALGAYLPGLGGDGWTLALGAAGLALAALAVRLWDRRAGRAASYTPKIVRVYPNGEGAPLESCSGSEG